MQCMKKQQQLSKSIKLVYKLHTCNTKFLFNHYSQDVKRITTKTGSDIDSLPCPSDKCKGNSMRCVVLTPSRRFLLTTSRHRKQSAATSEESSSSSMRNSFNLSITGPLPPTQAGCSAQRSVLSGRQKKISKRLGGCFVFLLIDGYWDVKTISKKIR